MRARTRRLWTVAISASLLMLAAVLVYFALREYANAFYTPEVLAEKGLPEIGHEVKVGGWVEPGSLSYPGEGTEMRFTIIDGSEHSIEVSFTGIAPDLFREGQGVMATGTFDESKLFTARQVLAKHDENYQPRELNSTPKPKMAEPAG